VEPGPELEYALNGLTSGVRDINMPASFMQSQSPTQWGRVENWTIARAAAAKPRLRAMFGNRVDYSMLAAHGRELGWPLTDREQAAQLVADLSALQLAAAPSLAGALRDKGWDDLATAAEAKR
jgi:hypothetical protein